MKKWMKSVLYIPKHVKPTDNNILRLLIPPYLGIALCIICLAGTTWAWFTASIQTAPQTIVAASYDITVSIADENGTSISLDQSLEAGQAYDVTLVATGTAPSGGYCVMQTGEKKWYTAQLKPGDSLTFTLIPETKAVYTFAAIWGSYSGQAAITGGCTIGTETDAMPASNNAAQQQVGTDGVYVVQSGDLLWEIAQQYEGISADEIAAYNGIDDPDALQIGQEIKIPPADYEIPEEPVSETAATDSSSVSSEEEDVPVSTETPPESVAG